MLITTEDADGPLAGDANVILASLMPCLMPYYAKGHRIDLSFAVQGKGETSFSFAIHGDDEAMIRAVADDFERRLLSAEIAFPFSLCIGKFICEGMPDTMDHPVNGERDGRWIASILLSFTSFEPLGLDGPLAILTEAEVGEMRADPRPHDEIARDYSAIMADRIGRGKVH